MKWSPGCAQLNIQVVLELCAYIELCPEITTESFV